MLAAIAAMLLPAAAHADERNFILQNATGRTIAEMYVSPANVNEWEENVLSGEVPDEENVVVRFVDDVDACVYDLKIVHDDGDAAIWGGINVCEAHRVIAAYQDDGTPIAQVVGADEE